MDYSRDQINRWEEEYKLPCDGKVRNAIYTLIEKVEVAKEKGCKVSKESQEAVDVLNQLMKADDHPFGGWAIFRP
tara:strand:+ start:1763 stop:1987 length:225 start_codon:yes stop_codon:yes gene_type:complete